MFKTILIANRGEIACRIMQTAQAMGVRCVAVYSDADANARHVEMADDAVYIGESSPVHSYLRGEVIIKAACAAGAEAIHPGYGFLSENPDFVEQVEAAGLTFIGPSSNAIRAMGLKDAAKVLMEKAGVPVVPGYHGADQSDDLLSREAEKIGYPVLIKAVAGGGGKGMRLVETPQEFVDALNSARSEAKAAFGNSDVLVEKFVTKPRHIEVQVFGDGETAVHLFERDCSLQRRHQKVIEEAPAPGMTYAVRRAMGDAAVRAAEAIGYAGAGTIEFIVDGSDGLREDGFWFMEMNTRLQVEHPVTEAVTGVDLVEWQLRVASGEALPLKQEELSLTGHSFEARIYAEDAEQDFLPATGRLAHLKFAQNARADTGVRGGDDISPFYDPMIAKLTVHGSTRSVALAKLRKALAETQVAGTVTNLGFLHALASHEGFAAGDVDTGLIARDYEALIAKPPLRAANLAQAAVMVAGVDDLPASAGFTLWAPLARTITLRRNDEDFLCVLRFSGADNVEIETPLGTCGAKRHKTGWQIDKTGFKPAKRFENKVVMFGPNSTTFEVVDPLYRSSDLAVDTDVVNAPMHGLVKAMLVKSGQKLHARDRISVLEAMKMEHSLLAPRNGVVAEVLAQEGDQVEAGAALVRLVPVEEAAS